MTVILRPSAKDPPAKDPPAKPILVARLVIGKRGASRGDSSRRLGMTEGQDGGGVSSPNGASRV
jgi:hypothetical protein